MDNLVSRENLPAWYELGVDANTDLIVRVHRQALDFLRAIEWSSAPIISFFQEKVKTPFIEPSEERWGFGEVLSWEAADQKQDFIDLRCPLPVIFDPKTGRDEPGAWRVSVTLSVLFLALNTIIEKTDCPSSQLLAISDFCYAGYIEDETQTGYFSVCISPSLCRWISKQEDNSQRQEIISAMQEADRHMWRPEESFDDYGFKAWFRQPRWVHLDCPGYSCGLDPDPGDYGSLSLEEGYQLLPHNVDTALQQLTLLSGIAALYQLARKEGF